MYEMVLYIQQLGIAVSIDTFLESGNIQLSCIAWASFHLMYMLIMFYEAKLVFAF